MRDTYRSELGPKYQSINQNNHSALHECFNQMTVWVPNCHPDYLVFRAYGPLQASSSNLETSLKIAHILLFAHILLLTYIIISYDVRGSHFSVQGACVVCEEKPVRLFHSGQRSQFKGLQLACNGGGQKLKLESPLRKSSYIYIAV